MVLMLHILWKGVCFSIVFFNDFRSLYGYHHKVKVWCVCVNSYLLFINLVNETSTSPSLNFILFCLKIENNMVRVEVEI